MYMHTCRCIHTFGSWCGFRLVCIHVHIPFIHICICNLEAVLGIYLDLPFGLVFGLCSDRCGASTWTSEYISFLFVGCTWTLQWSFFLVVGSTGPSSVVPFWFVLGCWFSYIMWVQARTMLEGTCRHSPGQSLHNPGGGRKHLWNTSRKSRNPSFKLKFSVRRGSTC